MDGLIDPHLVIMSKMNWMSEDVGDKSEYVVTLTNVVYKTCHSIAKVINEDYLMNFLTKLTE